MKKLVLLFIVSFLVTSCQKESQDSEKVTGLITEKAMVVSARVEASRIGTEILKKGGNAFDAMMATELALAVAKESDVLILVINLTGLYIHDLAQTGNPTFAITIDRETVRKKVLFPAIFAPVTIKNS